MMYKLLETSSGTNMVLKDDGWNIPINEHNSMYQQFKQDIQNGVELLDAEGNPITGAALTTFIGTLP
jgi:hypothetical protein